MTRLSAALKTFNGVESLSLDRKKEVAYSKSAMKHSRLSRIVYIVLLAAEVVKIAWLSGAAFSAGGSGITDSSVFEYAGLAALCLVPVMLFMLTVAEKAFAFCLPLLAIEKGVSLLSSAFLLVRAVNSLSFAVPEVSNFRLIFFAIMLCVVDDLALFIYCLWRRRKICG